MSLFVCVCVRLQCQNLHDSEHLTWLIVNHVSDLISLSHEPPVQDFISAVHRNSAASGLFIQAIQSRCDNLSTVSRTAPRLSWTHDERLLSVYNQLSLR